VRRVIEDMMARELSLLKAAAGNAALVMRVTLCNENSDFFAQGLLHPPDDPTLIRTLGCCAPRPFSRGRHSRLPE
jgi:hypothetical protein